AGCLRLVLAGVRTHRPAERDEKSPWAPVRVSSAASASLLSLPRKVCPLAQDEKLTTGAPLLSAGRCLQRRRLRLGSCHYPDLSRCPVFCRCWGNSGR